MTNVRIATAALFAACALSFAPFTSTLSAQSLFSTHGLGVSLDGVDARARAMGVSGVGLLGLSTTLLNPAEQGGTFRRGITATMQPWGGSASVNGAKDNLGGTRFPLMQVMYPYKRATVSLGYAGVLDQSWAIVLEDTTVLGTDRVSTRDVVKSTGGINELHLGAAYFINDRFSVGAAVSAHTGTIDRSITRAFPDSGSTLLGFETRTRWNYSGPSASVGVRWNPVARTRVGASIVLGGKLKAKPQVGSTTEYSYDMPTRIALGASSQLTPTFVLAFSTTISNYGSGSYTAPGMTVATVAQNGMDFGGGFEWALLRRGEKIYPLRAGVRYSQLPFHNQNETAPTERAASLGIGFRLAQDDYGPLAVADFGFEKGKRDGWTSQASSGGLTENFWRLTATISLFGR